MWAWKFGLDVVNISNELIDPYDFIYLAKEFEKSGWNGFFLWNGFLSDKNYYITNPLVTMVGIATQTTKIKLGFLVVPLPFFKPWRIVSEIATLDHYQKEGWF